MRYRELLSSYVLAGDLVLKNRIVMAPMTRCFAGPGLVPTAQMASYYASRAEAGLIITEAILIEPEAQGYPNTPGIFAERQTEAWKTVTAAVHDHGGRIVCQLWHTGRLAHSHYTGCQPLAPSSVRYPAAVPRAVGLDYEIPCALTLDEIHSLIAKYAQAARNAMEAGFDGVEIHGANGYLIDQFMHQQTNRRDDRYGGSSDNRARFALEVVDAVAAAIGSNRTGLRLSPQAYINLDYTEGDELAFDCLLEHLTRRDMLYLHLGAFDATQAYPYLGGTALEYLRRHYSGTLIGCGGYNPELAESALENWQLDLVAFGHPFIANPDLVRKIISGDTPVAFDESMLGVLV